MSGPNTAPSVLVVDDDPELRRVFTKALQGRASKVLQAEDPVAGVGILGREKPDVVFLDLHFPGRFTDREAVSLLRGVARAAKHECALFAVSGVFRRLPDIIGLYRAGADGFFSKPCDMEALRQAVAVTRGQQESGPAVGAPASRSVLTVTREPGTRDGLAASLRGQGFETRSADFGSVGLVMAHKYKPDAVVLDPDLSDMDGMTFLSVLKGSPRVSGAVVSVLAGGKGAGEESAFRRAGASFYHPEGVGDWDAIAVQLRRRLCGEEVLAAGGVALDLKARRVLADGAGIGLTATEFDLLACVMRESPRVVSWEEIETRVWGWDEGRLICKEPPTLHVILHRLRRKLGAAGGCLRVRRGVGLGFGAR